MLERMDFTCDILRSPIADGNRSVDARAAEVVLQLSSDQGTQDVATRVLDELVKNERSYLLQRIRGLMSAQLRSYYEPEDVLQEAFIRALRGWKKDLGWTPQSIRGWVVGIARLLICELAALGRERTFPHRRTPLPPALVTCLDGEQLGPMGSQLRQENEADLATCVDRGLHLSENPELYRLTPNQRMCMLMREDFEASWTTIGFVLGLNSSAVCQLYTRAKRGLHRR